MVMFPALDQKGFSSKLKFGQREAAIADKLVLAYYDQILKSTVLNHNTLEGYNMITDGKTALSILAF